MSLHGAQECLPPTAAETSSFELPPLQNICHWGIQPAQPGYDILRSPGLAELLRHIASEQWNTNY